MKYVLTFAAAILAAPLCGVLTLVVAYGVLWACGVTEHEGRRGLFALLFGLVPGLIGGAIGVGVLAWWLLHGGGEHRATWAGAAGAIVLAFDVGVAALYVGLDRAERLRISDRQRERTAWAVRRFAVPSAIVAAIVGYWLGVAVAG